MAVCILYVFSYLSGMFAALLRMTSPSNYMLLLVSYLQMFEFRRGHFLILCDRCGLRIILARHAILHITKFELTDFGSGNTFVVLSAPASLIIHVVLFECF